jgi:hypothetical protein
MDSATMIVAFGMLVFFVEAMMAGLNVNGGDDYMLLELLSDDIVVQKTTQVIILTEALFDYRLSFSVWHVSDALLWWVKPRLTTWFSHFVMTVTTVYDCLRAARSFLQLGEQL